MLNIIRNEIHYNPREQGVHHCIVHTSGNIASVSESVADDKN